MICQKCKQHEATVKVSRITNGEKKIYQWCKTCASGVETGNSLSVLSEFLGKVLDEVLDSEKKNIKSKSRACPTCKLTLTEFRKTGLFGCSGCYVTFSDEIRKMVFKIHGSNRHSGTIPGVKLRPNLTRLRKDLEAAIQNEEYEQAAHLRDLIRGIENEN